MSENSEEGGGSGKMLLVLGLLGGLAIGGGVTFYLFKDGAGAESSAAGVEEKEPEKPQIPLQSIRFDRLTVPISTEVGGRSRFIGNFFINIDVLVEGDENVIAVKRSEPQLKHAFIAAISRNNLMQEDAPQKLDMEKTSKVLKNKANSTLGNPIVVDVHVVEAMRLPN